MPADDTTVGVVILIIVIFMVLTILWASQSKPCKPKCPPLALCSSSSAPFNPRLNSVYLMTIHGKYLSMNRQGQVYNADERTPEGSWDLSNGGAKSNFTNRWMGRDTGGYGGRGGVSSYEGNERTPILYWLGDRDIAFLKDDKYLAAEDGGHLIWDRTRIGGWEKYRMVIPGDEQLSSVCLVNHHGKFLGVNAQGELILVNSCTSGVSGPGAWDLSTGKARATSVNRWMTRDPRGYNNRGGATTQTTETGAASLQWIDENYVAFKKDGKYLAAEDSGHLIWDRTRVGGWERFRVLIPGKEYCLRTAQGKYLTIDSFGNVNPVAVCQAERWTLSDGPKMRGLWLDRTPLHNPVRSDFARPSSSTTNPNVEMLFRGNTVIFRKDGRYLVDESNPRSFPRNLTWDYEQRPGWIRTGLDAFELVDPQTLPPPVQTDAAGLENWTCGCEWNYCGNGAVGASSGRVVSNLTRETVIDGYNPCGSTGWNCRNQAQENFPCATPRIQWYNRLY